MSCYLVTGGAGFIGSHLCEHLLEDGSKVINLDNFNDYYSPDIKKNNIVKALSSPDYSLVEGDIRDSCLLQNLFDSYKIDRVVHLAALAGVRKSIENPTEYVDVDIKGTVNILEACRKNDVSKLVFASSSSVYGSNPAPFKEDDKVELQVSPYAVAKRAGELYCKNYSLLYGIPVACLRFFTVYGPRQRPEMAIHNFTRLIDEEKEIPIFGDGSSSRDYTYIDDIIAGITSAADLQCRFEVFNLGSSHKVQLDYLIYLLEMALGKPAYKQYLPPQKGDVEYTFADLSKAKKMLYYEPRVGIEEGIERFISWYTKEKQSKEN